MRFGMRLREELSPCGNSEIRMSKSETSPNSEGQNPKRTGIRFLIFPHSLFRISDLFRISSFGFRFSQGICAIGKEHMSTITYSSGSSTTACALNPGESVLEGLERQGVPVPNSCRAGVCQSCLMQASAGQVPAEAQKGLKDSLKARGYFLACACLPSGDLTVHPSEHAAQRARAVVRRIERLSHDVVRVVL